MIITIGRECGCNGDEIGKALSEKYGIPCYNKKKLIELAKEKGIYDTYPFFFGERAADQMLSSLADNTHSTPKKALGEMLGDCQCVVVGRASNYVYKDRKDAVRVFLCGDKKTRTDYIAQKHQVTEKKAQELVWTTDDRRRKYHKFYTGEEWGYAGNYDLCLDVSKVGIDGVVAMVSAYIDQLEK